MPWFYWHGINHYGDEKTGRHQAQSPLHLKEILLGQGIALLTYKQTLPLAATFCNLFSPPHINPNHVCDFFQRLSLLVGNGVDLVFALKTIQAVTPHKRLNTIIHGCIATIQQGQSFHEALEHYPGVVPAFINQLIAAGERTGKLGPALENLTRHLAEQQNIKKQFHQATLAPLVTLGTALVLLLVVITFIFPYFESLYQSLGSPIPAATKYILQLSHLVRSWHGAALAGLGIIMLWFVGLVASQPRIKRFFSRIAISIPLIGPIIIRRNTLLFVQTLSLFLSSGLPLTTALEYAQNTVSNSICKDEIRKIYNAILEGKSLSTAIQAINSRFFDQQLTALILVGECSGTLDQILFTTAQQLSSAFSDNLKTLSTLFTPLLMIVVGLIIGGIMIALYLPIFNLSSLVRS